MVDYQALAERFKEDVLCSDISVFMDASEFSNETFTKFIRYNLSGNIEKVGLDYDETVGRYTAVHLETALKSFLLGKYIGLGEAGKGFEAGSSHLPDEDITYQVGSIDEKLARCGNEEYMELRKGEPVYKLLLNIVFDRYDFARNWHEMSTGRKVGVVDALALHRSLNYVSLECYEAGKELSKLYQNMHLSREGSQP